MRGWTRSESGRGGVCLCGRDRLAIRQKMFPTQFTQLILIVYAVTRIGAITTTTTEIPTVWPGDHRHRSHFGIAAEQNSAGETTHTEGEISTVFLDDRAGIDVAANDEGIPSANRNDVEQLLDSGNLNILFCNAYVK